MTDDNCFTDEQDTWTNTHPDDLWVFDKLILSKKLKYICGPVGTDVPEAGWYMVRPCVNAIGLGLGAQKVWIEDTTDYLPPGHFWCEWFEGRHMSVDYHYGLPKLTVEGFKQPDTFTRWDKWIKADDDKAIEKHIHFPDILDNFIDLPWVNCEFVRGHLIEVHFRKNPDFQWNNKEFIPVWEEPSLTEHLKKQEAGYRYVDYPDVHGRIGGFIK